MKELESELGFEYEDVTYNMLYHKCVQFAKEINDILAAEVIVPDNVFSSFPNANSFKNSRLGN